MYQLDFLNRLKIDYRFATSKSSQKNYNKLYNIIY